MPTESGATFEGRADQKLRQVNNLPCCHFYAAGVRSDHHGHDWQDLAFACPEEEACRSLFGTVFRHFVASDKYFDLGCAPINQPDRLARSKQDQVVLGDGFFAAATKTI
jgi:hypothetical protein